MMKNNRFSLKNACIYVIKKNKAFTFILVSAIIFDIVLALIPPLIIEKILNEIASDNKEAFSFSVAAVIYFVFLSLASLADSLQAALITIFGQKITHSIRSNMKDKLTYLKTNYFTDNEAGLTTSLFVNDVDTVEKLFDEGIINMFIDAFKIISILVIIFSKSIGIGMVLMVCIPLVYMLTRLFQRKMLVAQTKNREAIARINNHVPETIKNLRMIHSHAKQDYMESKYDRYICNGYYSVEKSNLYDSIYSPIIIVISTIIVAVMMVMAATRSGMALWGVSIGSAVAIITYVGKIFTPIESIGMEIENIQSALAGKKRIENYLSIENRKVPDVKIDIENKIHNNENSVICIDNVSFGYSQEDVISNLSLSIMKGDNILLAGRTGSGKSTIIRLILGLYKPDKGSIKIYGTEASDIEDSQKRLIFGYVEQNIRIIPGTVGEQISLGDKNVNEGQIKKAAQTVGMDSVIMQLSHGYETICNESLFSQGQLQLLSIARAIVTEPDILLLDEITANLDAGTENLVIKAIERASERKTVISVSHRIYENSNYKNCKKVLLKP